MRYTEKTLWFETNSRRAGTPQTLTVDGVEYVFLWCPAGICKDANGNALQLEQGFWLLAEPLTSSQWASMVDRPEKDEISEEEIRDFCTILWEKLDDKEVWVEFPSADQWEYATCLGLVTGELEPRPTLVVLNFEDPDLADRPEERRNEPAVNSIPKKLEPRVNSRVGYPEPSVPTPPPVPGTSTPGPLSPEGIQQWAEQNAWSPAVNEASSWQTMRTWTTTDGETLVASWDRSDESNLNVIYLVSNGEVYEIDLADLSEQDQQFIQQARQKRVSKFRKKGTPKVSTETHKAGDRLVKTVGGVKYAFRWCPAGKFMMGSPSNEPGRCDNETQHEVTLTKGFWVLETQVTQAMWRSVMGSTPSHFKGDDLPVECVSWDDCQEFCRKLSSKIGMKITLPTEAQWEYACRAGTTGPYAGDLDAMGWYSSNSGDKTHPVGKKQANAWGLYDMHGNVWEWCQDWYGDYPSGAVTDPTGPKSGSYRVNRGGSWDGHAQDCRSAYRNYFSPGYRNSDLGFRVVGSSQ